MKAWLAALPLLVACGGPPDAVRKTIAVAAHGLRGVDEMLAPRYVSGADRCREQTGDWEAYDSCMEPLETAHEANEASRNALLSLEAVVDAWDEAEPTWAGIAACAALSFEELAATVSALGIHVPEAVTDVVGLARAFGGRCFADH